MTTLIFLLICYGASNNIIYGSIFEGFRTFLTKFGTGGYSIHKLFTCMMCLPTWMGFVISYLLILFDMRSVLPINIAGPTLFVVFLHGLLATGGCWLIHTISEYFEK